VGGVPCWRCTGFNLWLAALMNSYGKNLRRKHGAVGAMTAALVPRPLHASWQPRAHQLCLGSPGYPHLGNMGSKCRLYLGSPGGLWRPCLIARALLGRQRLLPCLEP